MRPFKMLNLTAIAVVAALAFIEPQSSFAKTDTIVLCEVLQLVCDLENHHVDPITLTFQAISPELLSSIGNIKCEKSILEITLLNLLEKLILAHKLSWTLEGSCHLGSTSCTMSVTELGGISFVHGPNPLEWIGTLVPLEGRSASFTAKCGFLINCTYTMGEEAKTTATNSVEGKVTLVVNEALLKKVKGFCPETSKLDATYKDEVAGLWLES